jgi:hypothetical protein
LKAKSFPLNKNILTKIALLAVSVVLVSWGSTGHYKINTEASLSYNTQMSQFLVWTSTLADHASDADYRKDTDPSEAPKHYIDIDSYPEFIANGRIPQTLDSVIMLHGEYFVYDKGILPWATMVTFDSLRNCFARLDWDKAVLFAADLGHYVADGHMPMHITENYNGQLTGNNGIHSRYESTMINTYIGQINFQGMDISAIPNVNQYIFDYLYNNYTYVDSILAADNYAMSVSGGNTSSSAYKTALWNKTKGFTVPLFKNASHSIAELMYTAWVQAGCPEMSPTSIFEQDENSSVFLDQNIPNPFMNSTLIKYCVARNANVLLKVTDATGKFVETLTDEYKAAGSYSLEWKPQNLHSGVYYLVLKTNKSTEMKKMVLVE